VIGKLNQRFNWIGCAGCVFFRKSFVVHPIRVSTIGLPSARASLSPCLAKETATPSLSSQLNRSGLAGGLYANSSRSVGMPKMRKKADLPSKPCVVCGRPFVWRKKWEKVWTEVKFCSDACRMRKNAPTRQ